MIRRIMHIDLDAFFVSVEQVFHPDLKGKPVIVGGKPDRRGVVAAASYEARAFGIHSGMPLLTASCLCPQAIFIEGNFPRYRDASRKFMAILADFSPYLEPLGLDEAYLDATGFESIHGSTENMATAIRKRVKEELGICASIGIASGKVVAKIASVFSKPDGLLEIPGGEERSFLNPLPISKLPGIGKKSEKILKNMGIDTIGQLASLPSGTLKSHFGIFGETIHNHANGIDEREVTPPGEAKSLSRETTFAQDTSNLSFLKATLHYLSERVGNELRHRGQQARCITLKLRYADFTTITRQKTLNQAINTDQTIFHEGCQLLQKELSAGKQEIRLIGTGVSNLVETSRQINMLDPFPQKLENLNTAIDRIRNKYGFSAIQTGRTLLLRDIFPDTDRGDTHHHSSLPS